MPNRIFGRSARASFGIRPLRKASRAQRHPGRAADNCSQVPRRPFQPHPSSHTFHPESERCVPFRRIPGHVHRAAVFGPPCVSVARAPGHWQAEPSLVDKPVEIVEPSTHPTCRKPVSEYPLSESPEKPRPKECNEATRAYHEKHQRNSGSIPQPLPQPFPSIFIHRSKCHFEGLQLFEKCLGDEIRSASCAQAT